MTNYRKPTVYPVGDAITAIQGGLKGPTGPIDQFRMLTIGAYEGDE